MRALVFDIAAILRLDNQNQGIDSRLFENPSEICAEVGIKFAEVNGIKYFLLDSRDSEEPPVVIVASENPDAVLCMDDLDSYVFDRICLVVRSTFSGGVAIPYGWHQHGQGSIKSIYAASKGIGGGARLHFDTFPAGCNDLYFFLRTPEVIPFDKVSKKDDLYLDARAGLAEALKVSRVEKHAGRNKATGVSLTRRITDSMSRGVSLDDWYTSKLTLEQREFVDKPYKGPVRLRGAAGSGKTISLIIKFLYDGRKFELEKQQRRFCFLTHSSGTVNLVNSLCGFLDPLGLTIGQGEYVRLQIRTIYDLAFEYLRFDLDRLKPLSLDGREGRLLQAELVASVLKQMYLDRIAKAQFSDVSNELLVAWRSVTDQTSALVTDLLNEFGSILDADGIWSGNDKAEKYARGTLGYRPVWLMSLPSERDRRFVLEVHRRYRNALTEMNTLSMDQMVADFSSFLDRNTWNHLVSTKGFDAIFVDELHLFTSTEREILHKLIRKSVPGLEERPSVFMAYDIKQSPRDTFVSNETADGSLFSLSNKLQNSELVKLSKVFRYTRQIAEFLYDIDAAFPAIDLAGEWEQMTATSDVDGDVPRLFVYRDDARLFQDVFDGACKVASGLDKGKKAAVICLNEEKFDLYSRLLPSRFPGRVLTIDAREQEPDLRHSGKRVIFSMPEYVAGLQFDSVFLIHFDSADAPRDASVGRKRQFLSNAYLGASRAETRLVVAVSETSGGPASVLETAVKRGSIIRS